MVDIHYFTPIGLPVDCLSTEDLQSARTGANSVLLADARCSLRLIKNRSVQPGPTSFHFRFLLDISDVSNRIVERRRDASKFYERDL